MSNSLIPIDAEGTKEIAKTTGKAIDQAGKAGSYLAKIMGTVLYCTAPLD